MNQIERKVVIIGGGAAGMAAAVSGAKKVGGSQVCVLEKNSFLGRKLLATGNGRCNFTNINCDKSPQILDFFEELGVLHRVESQGRAYPYTEQAVTVQQALLDEIKGLQIQCICNSVDIHIQNDQDGFDVLVTEKDTGEKWRIKSENLMIATGGKAGVQYGCTGDGYVYAANFGHKLVKPIPSLVQLTCKDPIFKELKGVRSKAFVSLWCDGEKIDGELGEVQFTQEGLSGICIFNISRHLRLSKEVPSYDKFTIVIDLMPQFSLEDVKRRLGADLEKNLKG
ncbi:MAG: NAD(P)/FAD-dependent oxidoreductase, partial [Anaerovorax sp.]